MPRIRPVALPLALVSILVLSTFSFAAVPDRISGGIASSPTVRLSAGVPMQARPEFDQGAMDPSRKMSYITLLTKPTADQQKAINKLSADQQNPHSASYHKWLTPEQYADRFGLSQNDMKKVTDWLQSQGFSVVNTARARNWVAFSGTAAQVERAFQTQIHNFKVNGETHFANIKPPAIPAALSGVVSGLRGLNNFRARSQAHRTDPNYNFSLGTGHFLAPGDIAAIYDLNALYTQGFDGTGQSIAVIGQTDIYLDDLTYFRSGFNLNWDTNCSTSGTGVVTNTNCNTQYFQYIVIPGDVDPGSPDSFGDDLPEADIDLEWSGATARNAKIIYVNAPDFTGNGIYDSMYYAIDADIAPVMTMSYTFPCELAEADFGTYTADESEFAQANLEGITFMNSAGDSGAAECDFDSNVAVYGYAVAYPASSPSITGVGGTLIPYTEYSSTYWGPTNGTDGGSALNYIPEDAWNDSQEWSIFCIADPSSQACTNEFPGANNWKFGQETFFNIVAGGGGVSNCVVIDINGVCASGIPQPSYQSGIHLSDIDPGNGGVLNTPTRYSPDVSLLASIYWPGYIICTAQSELNGSSNNTSACSPGGAQGIINNMTNFGYSWGGTSISSPIFAGIVSMLNQYLNGSTNAGLGNINGTLYTLAATPSNNYFHQLGSGNIGAYCTPGTPNSGVSGDPWPTNLVCPSSGVNTGFVGFDASHSDPATGYNLAVGLGSVDAANLFVAWAGAGLSSTTTTLQSSKNPSTIQDSVTFTATVTPTGGTMPTGIVTFKDGATTIGTGNLGCLCNGTVGNPATTTFTTSTLAPGSHSITAVYGGDSNNAGSTSAVLTQVVNEQDFSFSGTVSDPPAAEPGQTTVTSMTIQTGSATFLDTVTYSCSGLPAGATCSFSPTSGTIVNGTASPQTVAITVATAGPFAGQAGGGVVHGNRRRAQNQLPRLWLPLTIPLAGIMLVGLGTRKVSRRYKVAGLCLTLILGGFLVACGGGGGTTPPVISVSVSPNAVNTLWPNLSGAPLQAQPFTATVSGTSNTAVTWAISSGATTDTIDSSGLYTAPTSVPPTAVVVTATSQADITKKGSATINIKTPTPTGNSLITVTVTEGSGGAAKTHTTTFTLAVQVP